MSTLRSTIHALYDRLIPEDGSPASGRIHPFIGGAFTGEHPQGLRIMALGINCYADDHLQSRSSWFPAMFENQKYRFQRAVLKQAAALAPAVQTLLPDRNFVGKASIYHSNVVKRWLPVSLGRHAHRVPEALFSEGQALFREELRTLAEAGVLPHLVIVFGNRPWSHVWPSFAQPKPPWVRAYEPTTGRLFHHLNLVHLHSGPPLLLIKLRHPTGARGKGMDAAGLIAHPDFHTVLGQEAAKLRQAVG